MTDKPENSYADYEDLSDALIWHKQEKRISQERYDELLQSLARMYVAYEGIKKIQREINMTGKLWWENETN